MTFFSKHQTSVFLIGLSAASLMTGYKVVRAVADSLFLAEFGASRIPWAMTFIPLVVTLGSFGFSLLLKQMGPRKTFQLTTFLAGLFFFVCYLGIIQKISGFVVALYLLKEVYVVILVAQHWSFINSVVTTEESKRLSGPVIGLSALGAYVGGLPLQGLPKIIGSAQMLPIVCGLTFLCIVFIRLAVRFSKKDEEVISNHPQTVTEHLGLSQFRKEKTVLYLALLVATTQVVSILFELSFLDVLQQQLPDKDIRSAYLVKMWNYMDLLAFIITFGVTPMLLSKLPMKAIQFAIPLFHMGSAALLWFHPSIFTASLAFFGFKAIDYNIFGAAKESFYVPLSFASRYRAKQFVDAIVYRSSKGITSGVISIVTPIMGVLTPASVFPVVCSGVSVVWIYVVHKLFKHQTEQTILS